MKRLFTLAIIFQAFCSCGHQADDKVEEAGKATEFSYIAGLYNTDVLPDKY
ncbi:MAG: hypothetical protein KKA07_00620 [Bacteroidetes bacterium]|nr:hypothetical protein [Bacteroidota bacterium]MBU1717554.1 hypothetical protein [Bacteroidota bacterium]